VWLAFALMLTIFHHPKAKIFCLASLRKKRRLPPRKLFFSLQESSPNKKNLLQDNKKSSASAQWQTKHIGIISGRCNFCGGCNYRYSTHQWT
jgi:hypothetical protein